MDKSNGYYLNGGFIKEKVSVGIENIEFSGRAGKHMKVNMDITILAPATADNLVLLQQLSKKIQRIELTK
ncbi:hypothetical protein ACPBEI_07990 [Latilactobacillus sakei]